MSVSQLGPPCFTPGTLIRVPRAVRAGRGQLKAGDLVETMDHGPQVSALGRSRTRSRDRRVRAGRHRKLARLGNDARSRVSPEHRMLVTRLAWRNCISARMRCWSRQSIWSVTAGITRREQVERVTYLHLLFDRHEIVFAEGAAEREPASGELAD